MSNAVANCSQEEVVQDSEPGIVIHSFCSLFFSHSESDIRKYGRYVWRRARYNSICWIKLLLMSTVTLQMRTVTWSRQWKSTSYQRSLRRLMKILQMVMKGRRYRALGNQSEVLILYTELNGCWQALPRWGHQAGNGSRWAIRGARERDWWEFFRWGCKEGDTEP